MRRTSENPLQAKFAEITFHEALTLSPTPSVPLGYHHPPQRGNGSQTVLCFGTCIELQDCPRFSKDANF
jgi:hypothetical protein